MDFAVRTVAERLLVGASASAEGYSAFLHLRLAFPVYQLEVAFYNERAVGRSGNGYCIFFFFHAFGIYVSHTR